MEKLALLRIIGTLTLAMTSHMVSANECAVPNDPYSPSGVINKGPLKGKCLQLDKKRSFRLVTKEEAVLRIPEADIAAHPNATFIANIKHEGSFWIGMFPEGQRIEEIRYLFEPFAPELLFAHAMLRVSFQPEFGPVLYPQTDLHLEPTKLSNLIVSATFLATVGAKPFNITTLFKDEYALVHQMLSLEEELNDSVVRLGHVVQQHPLNFSRTESNNFWKQMLNDFHDPEMTESYHLLNRNCIYPIFDSFYKFLKIKRHRSERVITNFPRFTVDALNFLGIADHSRKLPTLNDEFPIDLTKAGCNRLLLDANP